MSTFTVRVSRDIEAESHLIYQLLCDYVDGHPNILPSQYFHHIEVEQGGFGEGTVIKVQMKGMGLKNEMRLHVSEPKPGEVLQEEDKENGVITQFQIIPLNPKKSSVTIQTTWTQKKGIQGMLEKWIIPIIANKIYKEELEMICRYYLDYN